MHCEQSSARITKFFKNLLKIRFRSFNLFLIALFLSYKTRKIIFQRKKNFEKIFFTNLFKKFVEKNLKCHKQLSFFIAFGQKQLISDNENSQGMIR